MTQTQEEFDAAEVAATREALRLHDHIAEALGVTVDLVVQLRLVGVMSMAVHKLIKIEEYTNCASRHPDPEYAAQLKEVIGLQLKGLREADRDDKPWEGTP